MIGPATPSVCPIAGRHLFAGATLKYSPLFLLHSLFAVLPGDAPAELLKVELKMGKMQVLGVIAVILAVYCVHAKIYFREEFLDGGKLCREFL